MCISRLMTITKRCSIYLAKRLDFHWPDILSQLKVEKCFVETFGMSYLEVKKKIGGNGNSLLCIITSYEQINLLSMLSLSTDLITPPNISF